MNKLVFIGCDSTYPESKIVLFGAPFDGTTSFRPGTRFAPNTIRLDSDGIETYSPYQDDELESKLVHDKGDAAITFGNTKKTMNDLYNFAKDITADDKKMFMIGGEHLVSYAPIKALYEKYNDLRIVHFDAHTDLREDYLGEKMSHATVMKRVSDIVGPNRLYQFGIRSGLKEEFTFAHKNHYIEKFTVSTVQNIIKDIKDYPIYITLDLDVLDPSIMSGTGTPEPGGVTFKELHQALLELKGCNIVGADIVELAPHYDQSGVSTAVAAKLVREMLLLF